MKGCLAVVCIIFVLLCLAVASEEAVLSLEASSFDQALSDNEHIMVEFYAPWCGHCKQLAPEYEKAAKVLKDAGIALAKVDCTSDENRPICTQYEVRGFPTMKWFTSGSPAAYEGARTSSAIVDFAKKRSGPPSVALDSSSVSEFVGRDLYVFGLFSSEESPEFVDFLEFAKKNRDDYTFGHSFDSEFAASISEGLNSPAYVLGASFLEVPITFEGTFNDESFTAFLKAESFPLVAEISGENFMKFVDRKLPLVWLFVPSSEIEADSNAPTINAAKEVAADFKGKTSIVYLDGEKYEKHKEQMGHTGPLPAIMIEDLQSNKKFIFDVTQDVSPESIRSFIQAFIEGSLEAFLKSEEIPASNDEPVTVIVGKSFESIVLDSSKDVFVEYYAPWCGHCKQLAPIYTELGEAFQDEENVIIAKVDVTANDVPEDIKGFPTLIFYPAGSTESIKYEGARDLASMESFVRQNKKSVSTADGTSVKDEL